MMSPWPAEYLDDYDDPAEAAERYVNHVWASPDANIQHYLVLRDLGKYLAEMVGRDNGPKWNEALRLRLAATIRDVLGWETWRGKVEPGLWPQKLQEFGLPDQFAQ